MNLARCAPLHIRLEPPAPPPPRPQPARRVDRLHRLPPYSTVFYIIPPSTTSFYRLLHFSTLYLIPLSSTFSTVYYIFPPSTFFPPSSITSHRLPPSSSPSTFFHVPHSSSPSTFFHVPPSSSTSSKTMAFVGSCSLSLSFFLFFFFFLSKSTVVRAGCARLGKVGSWVIKLR